MNGASLRRGTLVVVRDAPALAPPRLGFAGGLALVAITGLLLAVYLDLVVYLHVLDDRILPKYVYGGAAALVMPFLAQHFARTRRSLTAPIALWIWAAIVIYFAHLLEVMGDGDLNRQKYIQIGIQYLLLLLAFDATLMMLPRTVVRRIFLAIVPIAAGTVVFDFLQPGTLYPPDTDGAVIGRAAGTFINPNRAAEVILLAFLVGLPAASRQLRVVLLVICGIAAGLTLSRAAIIGWCALWIGLAWARELPRWSVAALVVALVSVALALEPIREYLDDREDFSGGLANVQDRLDFFGSRDLTDGSAIERRDVIRSGVELFLANPVFGAGAARTDTRQMTVDYPHEVGTHNTPVMLAAEYGIVGVGLWCVLLLLVGTGRWFGSRRMQVVALAFMSYFAMFTHNMLFDAMFWLIAIVLFATREPDREPRPASTRAGGPVARTIPMPTPTP